jgi:hypothetical protein
LKPPDKNLTKIYFNKRMTRRIIGAGAVTYTTLEDESIPLYIQK